LNISRISIDIGDLMNKNTLALAGIFGLLAFIMALFEVPMQLGNPNLGTTPVSISAVMFAPEVSFIAGILKGIGASISSGKPYVEFAAGIGDAFMALFTFYLMRRMRGEGAIVIGQLSRYLFTASLVAFSVSMFVDNDITLFAEAWRGILPALTWSIIANSVVSVIIFRLFGKGISEWFGKRLGKGIFPQ